jgi:hypothetical protein
MLISKVGELLTPSLCHYNIALPVMRTYSGSETSKSWSTSLIVLSCCSNAGISSSIYNMTTKICHVHPRINVHNSKCLCSSVLTLHTKCSPCSATCYMLFRMREHETVPSVVILNMAYLESSISKSHYINLKVMQDFLRVLIGSDSRTDSPIFTQLDGCQKMIAIHNLQPTAGANIVCWQRENSHQLSVYQVSQLVYFSYGGLQKSDAKFEPN